MSRQTPYVSTDQVRAFVELVHFGSLRSAAQALNLSEEGLRSRLLVLEERLGVSLYEKERGRRAGVNLTHAGRIFHVKAMQFLEEAKKLTDLFELGQTPHEIRIAASHYIANYYLSDILKDFHEQFPEIVVQVSTGIERQIVAAMQTDTTIKAGICVTDEFPKDLPYRQLLSMVWCFIAPLGNPLLKQPSVTLEELAGEPLIVFEAPCPARQRILEAFYAKKLTPHVIFEVTTTPMVLNLIDKGIGTAIMPVLRSSTILDGHRAGQVPISDSIGTVEYGILSRKDQREDDPCSKLLNYILAQFAHERSSDNAVIANDRSDQNGVGWARAANVVFPYAMRGR